MHTLLLLVAMATSSGPQGSVIIMPIDARAGVTRDLADLVTTAFVPHAARATSARVTAYSELQGVMSQEQLKQVAGCNSTSCAAEIAGALDADEIVMGTLGRVGDSFLLGLSRVQARTARVVARATEQFPVAEEAAILDRLPAVAAELFGPAASAPVSPAAPPRLGPSGYKEPVSPDPEAARLFGQAMRAFWDGTAQVSFHQQAVARDPGLAASHLRLALVLAMADPAAARAHHAAAGSHRERLGERDLALLEASRPMLADPGDLVEWRARMVALAARYPRDAEVLQWLGFAHQFNLQRAEALAAFRAAVEADPSFAPAWWAQAQLHLVNNDLQKAREATDQCIAAAPYGSRCHAMRHDILGWQGRCKEAGEDARRVVANTPESPQGYTLLARSLLMQGGPEPAVQELLRQRRARLVPGENAAVEEQRDLWRLATWKGDFLAAEQALLSMKKLLANSEDRFTHESVALHLVDLYEETGQAKKACAVARDILPRIQGWPRQAAWASDEQMRFQAVLVRHGCITRAAFVAVRAAYVKDRLESLKAAGVKEETAHPRIWDEAYAGTWNNAADATEALEAFRRLDPAFQPNLYMSGLPARGELLLRAGKPQEALPLLRLVAQGCPGFDRYESVHAHLWLAEALEATGDVPGARLEYQRVVDAWGAARPASRSVIAARQRLKALPRP